MLFIVCVASGSRGSRDGWDSRGDGQSDGCELRKCTHCGSSNHVVDYC